MVSVLRGGPTALRIGRHVRGFEQGVADLFGKARGIMVNSGSSALYLAVELLGLEPGDEVLTSPLTFSTDIAPLVRAGLVPVFVDVERDTYNLDVDGVEAMIGPRTEGDPGPEPDRQRPRLGPPAGDRRRPRPPGDRGLLRLPRARRCGARPPGTRADISVTSFALSHIITAAGTGGMVCVDDPDLADRACSCDAGAAARRSSSTARPRASTSASSPRSTATSSTTTCSSSTRSAGTSSRPSCRAAFGEVQLAQARRQPGGAGSGTSPACPRASPAVPTCSSCPHQLDDLDTAWHMFPLLIRPEAGIRRSELPGRTWRRNGVDTRMVWTGNVAAPARLQGHRPPSARGRPAQRRPRHGVGRGPALQPRPRPTPTSTTSSPPPTGSSRRRAGRGGASPDRVTYGG